MAALDELGFHACGTLTDSADFIRKHQFVSGNNGSTLGLRKVSVPFHILIDATGARCPLFESLGFEQLTALKSAQVSRRRFTRGRASHPTNHTPHAASSAHFVNGKTRQETQLGESNWASQFHKERFARLKECGVDLQNMVYYRSTGAYSDWATHYFVMTASADSLLQMGALREAAPEGDASKLCSRGNLDVVQLEAFVRRAVGEFVPELEHHEMVPNQVGSEAARSRTR